MAWLRFTADYDHTPKDKPQVTVAYRAGGTYNVPREAADQALALGVASKATKPADAPATEGDDA